MKLCWDNIKNIKISRNGNMLIGTHRYIEEVCLYCGSVYLARMDSKKQYCSNSCKLKAINPMKDKCIVEKNKGSSKGDVRKKHIPLFSTYAKQLYFVDDVRNTIKEGLEVLEVRCSKCRKWFMPDVLLVENRIKCLNGKRPGESKFYCSVDCKENCEVYGQHKYPKGVFKKKKKYYSTSEYSNWKEEVLKRANYKCEYCNNDATDAHHIQPEKLEPFFALDPSNGLACCEQCHYKYGHVGECSTGNLASIICK